MIRDVRNDGRPGAIGKARLLGLPLHRLTGLREVRDAVPADVTAGEHGHDLTYFRRMCEAVTIAVDMGDSLRAPSTITAAARHSATGPLVRVGGTATIIRTLRLPI